MAIVSTQLKHSTSFKVTELLQHLSDDDFKPEYGFNFIPTFTSKLTKQKSEHYNGSLNVSIFDS